MEPVDWTDPLSVDGEAVEIRRRHYNAVRPHASLGYRAPAPEVPVPALAMGTAVPRRPASPAMASSPFTH